MAIPQMPHLLLIGCWQAATDRLTGLVEAGCVVTWLPVEADPWPDHDLVLVRLDEPNLLSRLPLTPLWLAWNVHDSPALALDAYAARAALVLPAATTVAQLLQSIDQVLASGRNLSATARRLYRRGEVIRCSPDAVLEIEQGCVAQSVIHADGAEVLLGLAGPGQLLTPHPEDNCLIQLVAHSNVTIRSEPWATASRRPDFALRLRTRLWHLEAWAAMQARPYLAERLLGILSVLAEQFGKPQPDGVLIDVRITHQQLAAAIGANRTTVTRLLSELRRRAVLTTSGHGHNERFCLLQWQQGHHNFPPPVAIATLG
jgi:CRP-like cAMP-binding protein